jgi:hypothetical protein
MSAEKNGGRLAFQCDSCPQAISTNETDFHAALGEAKAEGFIAFNRSGMWFHKCADCKGDD